MRSLLVLGLALLFLASAPTTSASPTSDAYFSGDRYQQAAVSGEKKRRYAKRYTKRYVHHQRAKKPATKTRVAKWTPEPARPRTKVIITPKAPEPAPPVTPLDDVAASPMYELSSYTRRAFRKIDTYSPDVDVPYVEPARAALFQEPPPRNLFIEVASAPFNIIRGFLEFLFRPAARCFEFENLNPRLKQVISDAARHFKGEAVLTSCYRSVAYNRQVYARMSRRPTNSWHSRPGMAADFYIAGVNTHRLAAYVRRHPIMRGRGGVGRYPGTGSQIVHVDLGPNRNWCWGCGGGKKRMYAKRKIRMASR